MSITFADLKTRLQRKVTARNGVPDSEQYDDCITDAVAAYSEDRPLRKRTEIVVVSGTTTYSLPTDFQEIIGLESPYSPDGTLVTGDGLIPITEIEAEEYTIAGGQITFYPTPTYNVSRTLRYRALHLLVTAAYPDMVEADVSIVLLKAQQLALQLQADQTAQEAWSYAIGPERVSKEKLSDTLAKRAEEARKAYARKVSGGGESGGSREPYGRKAGGSR